MSNSAKIVGKDSIVIDPRNPEVTALGIQTVDDLNAVLAEVPDLRTKLKEANSLLNYYDKYTVRKEEYEAVVQERDALKTENEYLHTNLGLEVKKSEVEYQRNLIEYQDRILQHFLNKEKPE